MTSLKTFETVSTEKSEKKIHFETWLEKVTVTPKLISIVELAAPH